jgi:hypothetical protein
MNFKTFRTWQSGRKVKVLYHFFIQLVLDQYYNMPDRLTLIENIISALIGISLFTYGTTWKNGKKISCSRK